MSLGVGCRCGSDLVWLWLATVASIRALAWALPYAVYAALKKKKRKKRKEKRKAKKSHTLIML